MNQSCYQPTMVLLLIVTCRQSGDDSRVHFQKEDVCLLLPDRWISIRLLLLWVCGTDERCEDIDRKSRDRAESAQPHKYTRPNDACTLSRCRRDKSS